jgi:hypothetical protein
MEPTDVSDETTNPMAAETVQDQNLGHLLRTHDWYYSRSDDYTAFKKGERSAARLRKVARDHTDELSARRLWKKHAPEEFGFPT